MSERLRLVKTTREGKTLVIPNQEMAVGSRVEVFYSVLGAIVIGPVVLLSGLIFFLSLSCLRLINTPADRQDGSGETLRN